MTLATARQFQSAQRRYDDTTPAGPSEVDDFVTDFSDGAGLWNEVLGNMDTEAQVNFMVRLKADPAMAREWIHEEAREYLYAFVAEHGLDQARESWG